MRKIYFLAAALLQTALVFGQMQIPFEDNFDAYTADTKLVSQVGSTSPWTTWSDSPGSTEDGLVSSAYSVSAPNSLKIVDNNDVVLEIGNLTTGRYSLSFNMYLAAGAVGYYNMLQDFAGASSQWGYQILFADGKATVQGNTEDYFDYTDATWFQMKTIVDLDLDWCEIYKDGEIVYEFKWSEGTTATNNKQLSAINFYGWNNDGNGICEYYIDNMSIKTVSAAASPTNLVAVIENINDVKLTWDAPTGATPDGYNVYRNGQKVASNITETTFTDIYLYPMAYTYAVKAAYADAGLSGPVSTDITIEGGVARKSVLVEVGTGTWCVNCPASARGVDEMHSTGDKVSIIEYHGGGSDSYITTVSTQRIDYYGIIYYPSAVFEGEHWVVGGSLNGNMYTYYHNIYTQLIEVPSVVDMNIEVIRTGETTFTATIGTEETFKYFTSDLKLRIALNESNIEKNWQNMTELDFVNRDMLEGAAGLNLDFSTQATQEFTVNFELPAEFVRENCEIVAFVQHDASKTVVNAVNSLLPADIVSVKGARTNQVALYPNPVQNTLYVSGIENADKIEVLNLAGQLIYSGNEISKFSNGFNTTDLIPGMYTVIIYTGQQADVLRFVK